MNRTIEYRAIGRIHSPWPTPNGMPIQTVAAEGIEGSLEIEPAFADGLRDLDGFSHVIVIWHMHLIEGYELSVVPFLDDASHGIFATRAPKRPNPIGLSVYRLLGIAGTRVNVSDVDAVDGSPILDLKPFVPAFDAPAADRIGWYRNRLRDVRSARADRRFE